MYFEYSFFYILTNFWRYLFLKGIFESYFFNDLSRDTLAQYMARLKFKTKNGIFIKFVNTYFRFLELSKLDIIAYQIILAF